jgi:hypothetical protein
MEYALAAMRRPEQSLYILVDRGFGGLDYLGPSELYPWMRRVTPLTATMILHWVSRKRSFARVAFIGRAGR